MNRTMKEIWVLLKGDCYAINTHCQTLKEAIESIPIIGKRSNIVSWWKNEIK